MEIGEFQKLIREIYYNKDRRRGVEGTFMWLAEEVGELAQQIRKGDQKELADEFGDVLAWLVSLASLTDIDLEQAIMKYASGCPKCRQMKCRCQSINPKSKPQVRGPAVAGNPKS